MLNIAKSFFVFAAVATTCFCLTLQANFFIRSVKDSHPVPSKWRRAGLAPGEHTLDLEIALKQSRFDELERHLYEGII